MADPAEDRGDDLDELMPDAALATDIPDEETRRAEQMKYYGGEEDEIDSESFDSVDRGDSLDPPEDLDEEEEEEQTAEAEGDDEADADDDDDDDEADTEDALDDDEESDDAEGDDGDVAESDDGESGEQEDTRPRDQRIPLSRFNEVNERMKRAEQRLAELEKQEQAVEEVQEGTYDFDAAEEEYTELLLNGDTKGAATKRAEIRSAEREAFLKEAQGTTQETLQQEQMMTELNQLTTQASQMYPIFDDTSDQYNQAATAKVLTFMRGYMSDGTMTPADAFVAALADGIEMFGLNEPADHQEDVDPQPKKKAAKKKTKEKLELAEKAPKSPANQGKGSSDAGAVVPDIEKMSDAEIDALPAATLARLRGDFVE